MRLVLTHMMAFTCTNSILVLFCFEFVFSTGRVEDKIETMELVSASRTATCRAVLVSVVVWVLFSGSGTKLSMQMLGELMRKLQAIVQVVRNLILTW